MNVHGVNNMSPGNWTNLEAWEECLRVVTEARSETKWGASPNCIMYEEKCWESKLEELVIVLQLCVGMTPNVGQVSLMSGDGANKDFTFDGAYFMDSTGEQIYNDIVFPLVEVPKSLNKLFWLWSSERDRRLQRYGVRIRTDRIRKDVLNAGSWIVAGAKRRHSQGIRSHFHRYCHNRKR